jgi:O-antigen ligase
MTLVRPSGYFNWVPPAMILLAAVEVMLSGREVSQNYAELAGTIVLVRHPVMPWLQPAVSLVLLLIAVERIAHHFIAHKPVPSTALAVAYVLYWCASVAAPALFGAHPLVGHEYSYSLIIGLAALLVTTEEISDIADAARNALFVLMLVSVVLIPLWPTMVMDVSYTQGVLPGVPRLGGVAPHPVAMGMFAQTGLLLLWARPFPHGWVNLLAWLLGLAVLFLAQSKAGWIAFVLCSLAMILVRQGPSAWRRLGDPREGAFGIVFCLAAIVVGTALLSVLLFTDLSGQIDDFLGTQQGAQLVSMTGRDKIWAIAISEWEASKFFGYGPSLFDDAFRLSIGMPNATSAHNQFMDTLARSGGVGAAFLVIYASVLLVLSVRYARRTGGLSLALFIALAVRSISEVPLNLFGYGTEFFAHLLLIATLAAGASMNAQATAVRRRPVYGVPA